MTAKPPLFQGSQIGEEIYDEDLKRNMNVTPEISGAVKQSPL